MIPDMNREETKPAKAFYKGCLGVLRVFTVNFRVSSITTLERETIVFVPFVLNLNLSHLPILYRPHLLCKALDEIAVMHHRQDSPLETAKGLLEAGA